MMMTRHYVLIQWRGTAVVWRQGKFKSSGTWETASLKLATILATVKPAGARHLALSSRKSTSKMTEKILSR